MRLYRAYIVHRLTHYRDGTGDALCDVVGKPLADRCRHDGQECTPETTYHGEVLVELIENMGLTNERER